MGIIPAYAGNTTARNASTKAKRDHPRVCGEHKRCRFVFNRKAGSSPRMRGTLQVFALFARPLWIIPAYAGNTHTRLKPCALDRDHPRVCGEHFHVEHGRSFFDWIIPAYAGNTIAVNCKPCRNRDHPRVCGEHHVYRIFKHPYEGSSPRMRGTREQPLIA